MATPTAPRHTVTWPLSPLSNPYEEGANDKAIFFIDLSGRAPHRQRHQSPCEAPAHYRPPVKTGNNGVSYATAEGEVGRLDDASTERRIMLKDVAHSRLRRQPLSVERARKSGYATFEFHDKGCTIIDTYAWLHHLDEAPNGPDGRLAVIESRVAHDKALVAMTPEVWHHRYGHLPYPALERLQDNNMVTGINTTIKERYHACDPCALGKSTRPSFKESIHRDHTPAS